MQNTDSAFHAQQMKIFLKKFNFKPNDLLGQNFLTDENILTEIVEAGEITSADEVLEIGPGIGNLTELLSQKAKFVLAVEKDERYFPILKERLGEKLRSHSRTPKSSANVQVAFGDILRFNFQELLNPGYKVIANIPYYITGQIIEMLLSAQTKPGKIVLLVQKEVAQRIAAPAGDLSILAISVQLFAEAKIAAIVPKEAFYPQPKVDSAVIVLDILDKPKLDVDQKKFFRLVKACFAGKRKQIHNTLKNNLGIESEKVEEVFKATGIDTKARPQELTLEQWYKIYTKIY